jgi:hypothetical protein
VKARRDSWAYLLLGTLVLAALACGSTEVSRPGGAAVGDAAHLADLASLADQAHLGPGAVRCSRCHTAEQRDHATWRETAMRLGHAVQSRLEARTACKCCHLGDVKGFGEPLDRVCTECHDDIRITITAMGSMHCLGCHDPTASGGALIRESAWECQRCHTKDQGDKPAIDVHAGEDCANCHRPHQEPWTLPRLCTECHVGHETFHGAASRDADGGAPRLIAPHDAGAPSGEPMACATCHRPHEVGGAASGRCYACHAARDPAEFTPAATGVPGHARCTTCHEPHSGDKPALHECRSCHSGVVTMEGRGAVAHGKCVSCHQPHDLRGTPKGACAGCHLSVHPEHLDPEGKGCVGCHDPHPGPRVRAVVAATASPGSAFPRALSPVTCSRCHTKAKSDLAFHAGTTPCKDCHTPHTFTAASARPCSACHARQNEAGIAAGGHGHAACKACHETHDAKAARPACGSCHAEEAKTAPSGHAQCLVCHDAHPPSRTPKAQCSTCHAPKKLGPHASVACSSCHRAHGPDAPAGPTGPASRPDCLSCHTPTKLGGMHTAAGHATCASCHAAHQPPSSSRKTCLSCHADRKDHEPTAAVCSGCHGFAKGR